MFFISLLCNTNCLILKTSRNLMLIIEIAIYLCYNLETAVFASGHRIKYYKF